LEGEEMFGSTKCKANFPPGSKVYSHWHDWVNFFGLKVANAMTLINQSSTVDVGEVHGSDLVITHNGAEVFERFYGDDIW
jgi:hypothetical protein